MNFISSKGKTSLGTHLQPMISEPTVLPSCERCFHFLSADYSAKDSISCLSSGRGDAWRPTSILFWKPGLKLEFSLLVALASESHSHLAFRFLLPTPAFMCMCVWWECIFPASFQECLLLDFGYRMRFSLVPAFLYAASQVDEMVFLS